MEEKIKYIESDQKDNEEDWSTITGKSKGSKRNENTRRSGPPHADIVELDDEESDTDSHTSQQTGRKELYRNSNISEQSSATLSVTSQLGSGMSSNEKNDLVLIHDSICRNIDIDRLVDRSGLNGVKRFAGTLRDAEDLLDESDYLKVIILHAGINDLKSKSIEDTFSAYNRCVSKCRRITDRVILSLLTPSKDQTLGGKIVGLNNSILSSFQSSDKLTIYYNDNFNVRGKIIDKVFTQDGIHLSVGQGVRVLASNLRNCIFEE